MSSNRVGSKAYRKAAWGVEQGNWTQSYWHHDVSGKPCMLQAILDAAGISGTNVPEEVLVQLHGHLLKVSAEYVKLVRQLRHQKKDKFTKRTAIIVWNDRKKRRAQEVAAVLHAVADKLELGERRIQAMQDKSELAKLRADNERLEAEISRLDRELGIARRVLGAAPWRQRPERLPAQEGAAVNN